MAQRRINRQTKNPTARSQREPAGNARRRKGVRPGKRPVSISVVMVLHLGKKAENDAWLSVMLPGGIVVVVYLPPYLTRVMKAHFIAVLEDAHLPLPARGLRQAKALAGMTIEAMGYPDVKLLQVADQIKHGRVVIQDRFEAEAWKLGVKAPKLFELRRGKGTRVVADRLEIVGPS